MKLFLSKTILIILLLLPLLLKAQLPVQELKSFKSSDKAMEVAKHWITDNVLYNCAGSNSGRIALADVDFSRMIIKSNGYYSDKNFDVVCTIAIVPKSGKTAYGSACEGSTVSNSPISDTIKLQVAGRLEAMQEFDRIKKIASTASVVTGEALLSKVSGPVDGEKEAANLFALAGNNSIESSAEPAKSSGSFDSQLLQLINGAKNRFQDLKGTPVSGTDDFESRVKLEGSVSTRVMVSLIKKVELVADFGEFPTQEAGMPVYEKLIKALQLARGLPMMLAKLDEQSNQMMRITGFASVGGPDEFKDMAVMVELTRNYKFDKQMNKSEFWMVLFRIDP